MGYPNGLSAGRRYSGSPKLQGPDAITVCRTATCATCAITCSLSGKVRVVYRHARRRAGAGGREQRGPAARGCGERSEPSSGAGSRGACQRRDGRALHRTTPDARDVALSGHVHVTTGRRICIPSIDLCMNNKFTAATVTVHSYIAMSRGRRPVAAWRYVRRALWAGRERGAGCDSQRGCMHYVEHKISHVHGP